MACCWDGDDPIHSHGGINGDDEEGATGAAGLMAGALTAGDGNQAGGVGGVNTGGGVTTAAGSGIATGGSGSTTTGAAGSGFSTATGAG